MELYLKPGAIRLLKHLIKKDSFVMYAGNIGAYIGDLNDKCIYKYNPQYKSFSALLSNSLIYKYHEGKSKTEFYKVTDSGRSYLMEQQRITK